jgi:Transposase DDE domain group 1
MIRQTVFGFKIERTQEQLTAHGGLALLAEYNHGMGLRQLADQHLPAPGSNRGYAPSAFVESLVLLLQAGGQRLEDLRELEQEAALMKLVGREVIPDPDTLGDWLRRMGDPQTDRGGLQGLGPVRDLLNQRLLRHDGITEYTLDADAMQIEAEKREATWTYQGVKGYMPLLGFLFETPVCLYEEFREGHVSPSSDALPFYRHCQQRLPKGKRIASYRADLINALEADGVYWAITADQDRAVKEAIGNIPEADWKEPTLGCGYEMAETVHTMARTHRAFRLVVKRELRRQVDLFQEDRYFSPWPATGPWSRKAPSRCWSGTTSEVRRRIS